MGKEGVVYLIPTYLSEQNNPSFLAPMVLDIICNTEHYLVENQRTARRFISSLKLGLDISALDFQVLDKKTRYEELNSITAPLHEGKDLGVISEAGLPGLADPGNKVVAYAHQNGIKVIPLPGASAIQTALITSGFNGQAFTFHGYLPIERNQRSRKIKDMEKELKRTGFTQIFMETPFRNTQLLDDLLKHLDPQTLIHIAADIFGSKELTKTLHVTDWKRRKPELHKIPCVFCIGYNS